MPCPGFEKRSRRNLEKRWRGPVGGHLLSEAAERYPFDHDQPRAALRTTAGSGRLFRSTRRCLLAFLFLEMTSASLQRLPQCVMVQAVGTNHTMAGNGHVLEPAPREFLHRQRHGRLSFRFPKIAILKDDVLAVESRQTRVSDGTAPEIAGEVDRQPLAGGCPSDCRNSTGPQVYATCLELSAAADRSAASRCDNASINVGICL